jgi:hypothetical protein
MTKTVINSGLGAVADDAVTIETEYNTAFDATKTIEFHQLNDSIDGDPISNTFVGYYDCLEEKCQLWDSVNSRCGAQVSDTIRTPSNESTNLLTMLEGVVGKIAELDNSKTLISYLIDILGKNAELLGDDQSILKLIKHTHDTHHHAERHWVDEVYAPKGSMLNNSGVAGDSILLIQEVMSHMDIDGNGEIFMTDFKISMDDPNLPPSVHGFLTSYYYTNEDPDIKLYTWGEYQETLRKEGD